MNKIKIDTIKEFWNWFAHNCNSLEENYENTELLDQLDQWIYKLGDFSWEIGPGINAANALTISPNGDKNLLQSTKTIITYAKKCSGWEFYYAVPPKNWNLIFDFETKDNYPVEINAQEWEYVLLKYEDDMFEIIIKATNLNELRDDDKIIAAEILLDGVIGEEQRIQDICAIEVVNDFDKEYRERKSNITNLIKHLNELKKRGY